MAGLTVKQATSGDTVISQYVQRPGPPATVLAVRYRYGQPLDDLRTLALFDTASAELVEVPEWRRLLIRLVRADNPYYLVVPDGRWLVYPQRGGYLAVRDDETFTAAYSPPQPDLLKAVAEAIGQHMILRESPAQIAGAALAAASAYRHQETAAPVPGHRDDGPASEPARN